MAKGWGGGHWGTMHWGQTDGQLAVADPTVATAYSPRPLITITKGATVTRYSTEELYVGSQVYTRAVLNDPDVVLSHSDPLIGILDPHEVTLELLNENGYFTERDMRGALVSIDRYDTLSGEQWFETAGTVVSQTLGFDHISLRVMTNDLNDLQTLLPKEVVTDEVFPLADPEQGLGRAIPIVFGNLAASTNTVNDTWELPWVGDDRQNNYYDYLVGRGTFTSLTVYRDTVGDKLFLVPSSEYTVNTTAYAGFTVIRFTSRQRTFGGGFHRIFAAGVASGTDRRFSSLIKFLLNDATQGLGLSVNTSSFTTAATDLDAVAGLYCDVAMTEQRPAVEWLRQLVLVRGMRLALNGSGEYTLTVDKAATTIQARFGHGLGQSFGGPTDFTGLDSTPVSESIKSFVLEYRKDAWSGKYLFNTATRTVLPVGTELRVQNDCIRNRVTADKVASYLAQRLYYQDTRMSLPAGQLGRKLRPGEIVRYESTTPALKRLFSIKTINRGLTESTDELVGWNPLVYVYDARRTPTEPAASTDTDWSRSTPTAAGALLVISSGIVQNDQGVNHAYMDLQYSVPNEPWARTVVRYGTKTGTAIWTSIPGEEGTGKKTTRILGLTGNQIYDLRVTRENILNPTLFADADLDDQTVPGDTTPPSNPTAITLRQAGAKVVEITVSFTPPGDWAYTRIFRNTTNDPNTATSLFSAKTYRFTDQNVTYGSTYYYWAKVYDESGNASGFSPSTSNSITVTQIVTEDVTDGNITTPKVADTAITVDGIYTNDTFTAVTTEVEIGTLTISTNGGTVIICGKTAGDIGSGAQMVVRIRKDSVTGTQLDYGYMSEVAGGGSAFMTVSLVGRDTSPAATQTYKLTAVVTGASSSVEARRLYAMNRKK